MNKVRTEISIKIFVSLILTFGLQYFAQCDHELQTQPAFCEKCNAPRPRPGRLLRKVGRATMAKSKLEKAVQSSKLQNEKEEDSRQKLEAKLKVKEDQAKAVAALVKQKMDKEAADKTAKLKARGLM